MASNNQKKTTTKKSNGKNTRSKKTAQSQQKRPVRREIIAVVLLLLALLGLVSYFDASAVFVGWLAKGLKGLFGYGYWLAPPAMLLAGIVLLRHHGRPVWLRVSRAPPAHPP